MERYRGLKGEQENRESETADLLEEIKMVRERMKEVADETRLKDDLYKQLVSVCVGDDSHLCVLPPPIFSCVPGG